MDFTENEVSKGEKQSEFQENASPEYLESSSYFPACIYLIFLFHFNWSYLQFWDYLTPGSILLSFVLFTIKIN